MKVFLIILLVILIMMIANGLSKQYKDRNNIFNSIMQFLNKYELNIGFKKEKIKDVVHSFSANNDVKLMFDNYLLFLNKSERMNFSSIKVLQDEERDYLTDMFTRLGTGDYQTEMMQLKVHKEYIQSKIQQTTFDKNKFCPLIIKLSLLFGLGVALILL